MLTERMINGYKRWVGTFVNRYSCLATENGQIWITIGGNPTRPGKFFLSVTIYSANPNFGWADLPADSAKALQGLENKTYTSCLEAEAGVEHCFKQLGLKLVKGVAAWARMIVQMTIMAGKWRTLKEQVPRPKDMPLSAYRKLLLKEFISADWPHDLKGPAQDFHDCAQHLME